MMAWLPRTQYSTILVFINEISNTMVTKHVPMSKSYLNLITREMDNLVQFKADEEIKKANIGLKVPSLNMVGQTPSQSSNNMTQFSDQSSNNMTPICYTS